MKNKSLREDSTDNLLSQIKKLRKDLMDLRLRSQEDRAVKDVKISKKQIARIYTILAERKKLGVIEKDA